MTSVDDQLDEEQKKQEVQYGFPYHYIPTTDNGSFSQTRQWSWGYRYLGGIRIVLDQLSGLEFDSLVDIGCGDGRFLREFVDKYPHVETLGIDYSQQAINLANAMNSGISYECRDIVEGKPPERYDIATLIEVLEHIPSDDLSKFLDATLETLTSSGTLILTVPHTNSSVQEKHYQHFNRQSLTKLLCERFQTLEFVPFDQQSKVLHLTQKLLGGRGNQYVITNDTANRLFWRLYTTKFLYTSENKCARIAVVCHR